MQVRGEDLLALTPAGGEAAGQAGQADSSSSSSGGTVITSGRAGSCGMKADDGGALAAARRLRGPFRALEEGGMGQVAEMCREAGLHHVFLTALKL